MYGDFIYVRLYLGCGYPTTDINYANYMYICANGGMCTVILDIGLQISSYWNALLILCFFHPYIYL